MSRTPRLALRLLRTHFGATAAAAAHPNQPQVQKQLSKNAISRVGGAVGARGVSTSIIGGEHTAKWMTNYDKKTPQELIAEVPPIEVGARVVACEGGRDPSLGHPIEYICLDLDDPAVCKYCGLRYVQAHHHH